MTHVKAPNRLDVARRRRIVPIRSDEQVDRVLAPLIHERRNRMPGHIIETAAD